MRELRDRTRAKLDATTGAKPLSVYLAPSTSRSWGAYETARRLKRERVRAGAGAREAPPTGDVEKAAVGAMISQPLADGSDLGGALTRAEAKPYSGLAAPGEKELFPAQPSPRWGDLDPIRQGAVPAPGLSHHAAVGWNGQGSPRLVSLGEASPSVAGGSPALWDRESLSFPTAVSALDGVMRQQSALETGRRVRGLRDSPRRSPHGYVERRRLALPPKPSQSRPGDVLSQITAHAQSRAPAGGEAGSFYKSGRRPVDMATKRGLPWQNALRDDRLPAAYGALDIPAELNLEDEAEERAERVHAQRVRVPRDGVPYKPALEIIKAARIEAAHAAMGPFAYGDFEF